MTFSFYTIIRTLSNTATDFIIINKGNIIEEISKEELSNKRKDYVYLTTSNNSLALEILKNEFPNVSIKLNADYICLEDFHGVDSLSELFLKDKISIREIRREKESLEDYVFNVIRS